MSGPREDRERWIRNMAETRETMMKERKMMMKESEGEKERGREGERERGREGEGRKEEYTVRELQRVRR